MKRFFYSNAVGVSLLSFVLASCGGGSNGFEAYEDELTDIRIENTSDFNFLQDSGNRSDKVVGTAEFTLTDLSNNRYVRDLDNSNMYFQERQFGSESAFVREVEATQSSDIEITPIDVVYLIDNSFSVVQAGADNELVKQANALATQINQQNDGLTSTPATTKYRLFANQVTPLRTGFHEEPFQGIEFEGQGGGTALYEGIQLSLLDLSTSKQPVLFVFTDGRENASNPGYDLDLIRQTSEQYQIPIYIAGLGDVVDSDALKDIATASGGAFFQANSVDQLSDVFEDILYSIPVKYTVVYRPTQRTGHVEFQFVVDYKGASDSIAGDFDVDLILGN